MKTLNLSKLFLASQIALIMACSENNSSEPVKNNGNAITFGTPYVNNKTKSATGVTYGSVTAAHVAEELKKLGHDIDRKIIIMRDIKKVGDYVATIQFHKEVTAEIPVTVVAENAPVVAAPVVEEEAPAAAVEEQTEETAE